METVYGNLIQFASTYGLKIIGAVLIFLVGRMAAGIIKRGVARVLARRSVDPAIVSFTANLTFAVVLVFTVIASLAKFGVQTTSFVAVLGAAGFAVGFALQGSLSSFAAGVLILVLRPFRQGDYIEAAGVAGTVQEIQLFVTVLSTPDNVRILVPNSKIYGDTIKNYSANPTRRIDLVIGVGYGSSLEQAQEVLARVIQSEPRVLQEPTPQIAVAELADSSVNFVVRPWVKREDYWSVRFDLTERIKQELDQADIEIPFPQRTVHMASAG